MYCNQCGQQITDHSKFCSYCGVRVDDHCVNNTTTSVEKPVIMQRKLEQDIRKGMLVYLRDILSMEFSVHKLEQTLNMRKASIFYHDNGFIWKRFRFERPIQGLRNNEFSRPYIGLYLSYLPKLDKYFYMFDDGSEPYFTDIDGNKVSDRLFGNPCNSYYSTLELTPQIRTRLCTPPILEKKWFSGEYVLTNKDSTCWSIERVISNREQMEVFTQIQPLIEKFEEWTRNGEKRYQQETLPFLKTEIAGISKELSEAKRILKNLYDMNIIPGKFRNIGCAHFIYDFFSTSNVPLDNVFLHLDLDKIQSQLETVIKNQSDMILQQAILISQNEEIIAQNEQLFNELCNMNQSVSTTLSDIQKSSIETSEWARIASLNAEACAWIGLANYIKK